MDKVFYLSGTTRGGTLEGLGRAFAPALRQLDIELVEISLLNFEHLLRTLQTCDLAKIRFVLSGVGMGLDIALNQNGQALNVWQELGLPVITMHGDSPAYFFERHMVKSNNFISLYGFAEHCELRRRFPGVKGPIGTMPSVVVDEIPREQLDVRAKRDGTLLFLKNGKDPAKIRGTWKAHVEPRILRSLCELADELESQLDAPASNQIDDLVLRYFEENGFDVEGMFKLRMFFIAQLDDYLRAVKCTRMAHWLMEFPVQIRGNEWGHVDFAGRRATYIDDCNYVDSIGLIRGSLGLIDMSPNTASGPHDRVMRAYGSRTLCLTNAGQRFMAGLPFEEESTFQFTKESVQERVADLLANKCAAIDMGVATAEAFRARHPPEQAFETMLEWASLARLDQRKTRPEMQDFFLWPPAGI
jgi:hypothetical protein